MTDKPLCSLIAADVGNSAIKLGWFQVSSGGSRPDRDLNGQLSEAAIAVANRESMYSPAKADSPARLPAPWVARIPSTAQHWYAASVHGPLERELASWIHRHRPQDHYLLLRYQHFPLKLDVRFPQGVGTDRLAAAVAVNALRAPSRPAIVIDVGTAVTIDAVATDGLFLGGVILPGVEAAAAALATTTDALPRIQPLELSSPPVTIGKSTVEAMHSGIVRGTVGAIREHVSRMTAALSAPPEIYCTGRAGRCLVGQLGREFRFHPNLVLRGIALAGLQQKPSTEHGRAGGDRR